MNKHSKNPIIEIKKVTRTFGKLTAVKDLSLTIYEGEIFGFLGPNGAGKSTTFRMLTTLLKPDCGDIIMGGYDVVKEPLKAKQQIGVVQQVVSFDRDLTLWDNMEFHARLHGYSGKEAKKMVAETLEFVGLSEYGNVLSNDLSGGMKRISQIARALMHNPQIILLDEPTTSLDAQTRRKIWSRIRMLRENGATVVLTTHYIEEAEALCDRVGIIHKGELIALDTPLALRKEIGLWAVEYATVGKETEYKYLPTEEEARVFALALPEDKQLIKIRPSNLEDVFIEYTGEHVNEDQDNGGVATNEE